MRDDRPFGGPAPPAAMFYYSRDRSGKHPQAHLQEYAGIFQADAYGGYTRLYEANCKPGPLVEAACWVHYLESDFIWSSGRPRQPWRVTASGGTPDNFCSIRATGGTRAGRAAASMAWRERARSRHAPRTLQRITLHLQVGGDVPAGRGDAGMAEIVADHGHVGARLKQRDRATVAQHMGIRLYASVGRSSVAPAEAYFCRM